MEVLRPPAERGVTLVETLIALLILAVVAISILTMFSQGMQLNIAGADYTALTNLAKDKAEELLGRAYSDAELATGVAHSETVDVPPAAISWRVAEHQIAQGSDDPATVFGGDPLTSTVGAGTGNLKVIAVTVASRGQAGLGRRDVTVQAIKVAD